jgi:hypothetical protein
MKRSVLASLLATEETLPVLVLRLSIVLCRVYHGVSVSPDCPIDELDAPNTLSPGGHR